MIKRFETKIGEKSLIIETGKYAKQAGGSCTVQLGGTVVLVACVASKKPRENIDFFPLTVEYQEKTYAAGKIPGGFFKREGRPTEKEILTARLIDRPIRPLFPKGFVNEVQIMAMVLSSDGQNDSDVLAMIGASCALSVSSIPFEGPIAAVRVGRIGDEFVINPTFQELDSSSLDLVVTGTREGVIMLEGDSKEVKEELLQDAVAFGCDKLKSIIALIEDVVKECGKKKSSPDLKKRDPELRTQIERLSLSELDRINKLSSREERMEALGLLTEEIVAKLVTEDGPYKEGDIKGGLEEIEKEKVRRLILEEHRRVDGRGFSDLRPISCEVSNLPRTHGSGLFTRGQTQSLAVTTLGTSADEQMIDALEEKTFKNFMLHYNFPPFSVGEVRPVRGPGRREIGHGALAERALKAIMPSKEDFPYTIRVVSDILESNGSSSMATVCAGSLSLMDAAVPIKAAVSGIAIGLVKEGQKEILLTDIGGVEDHYGDMDFKVAGTREGITAIQMDLKISGISLELINRALAQAQEGRLIILDKMDAVISKPKESISEFAPKIVTLRIDPSKIGELIGPGGKTIKKITAETGATIDIEDDGTVQIATNDTEASKKAVETVKRLTENVEVGKIYMGKVKRIMDFGVFCEVLPGKEGLVHISELADKYVKKVEDEVKLGDEFPVKVIEIDPQGRINLSKKQAMPGSEDRPHERQKNYRRPKGKH